MTADAMQVSDTAIIAFLVSVAVSPVALVIIIALIRGYTIQINVRRSRIPRRRRDDDS